ncbi:MAG: endonuclease V, partial [Halobacteria archaeon]|nr:endonuclease V [Halobacteria archaeon]
MKIKNPELAPRPTLSRSEMENLQYEVASEAVFADKLGFDPSKFGELNRRSIAGVDQAFLNAGDEDRATRSVSVVVVLRNDEVVERVHAVEEVEVPYIPGLLSYREGPSILSAFEKLDEVPDVVLFDGSGRIHFRQAGIATHMGVVLDVPSVGVAKSLLCGEPETPLESPLSEGTRVRIRAGSDVNVDAPENTVIGYAYQSRQY